MDLILVLLLATTFPVGCLGFLLWMARFEDGLPEAVRRAAQQPDPPPVLAIPVQRREPALEPAREPAQQPARQPARQPAPAQAEEGSRSLAVSFGGSTNR